MLNKRIITTLVLLALTLGVFMTPTETQAAVITVDTTRDVLDAGTCNAITIASLPGPDGDISLREAICAANNNAGSDTIEFDIPLSDLGYSDLTKTWTIYPTIALPVLIDGGTTINGYSQMGAQPANDSGPADIRIVLNGSLLDTANGLSLASSNNVIKGLVIRNCPGHGIGIYGPGFTGVPAANNVISGNHIGTNDSANSAQGNGRNGVLIGWGAQDNLVGGGTPADRNVISGNDRSGVDINGENTLGNTLQGNYIGTNGSGTAVLGNNLNGVYMYGSAHDNLIGPNNLVSGNLENGIYISGAHENVVTANFIGSDVDGGFSLGNVFGLLIGEAAQNNIIASNLVSGNQLYGIALRDADTSSNDIRHNIIGVSASGVAALANSQDGVHLAINADNNLIEENLISGNGGYGIVLSSDNNLVQGNAIGTDGTASAPIGNHSGGVRITLGGSFNTIGGDTADERNLISGNEGPGVTIHVGSDNVISGNFIGTDGSGDSALGNKQDGVLIQGGSTNTRLGGSSAGERNVISGNEWGGVSILDPTTTGSVVSGNFIGTDLGGTVEVGNQRNGVHIRAPENVIGGNTSAERNVISGNGYDGILLAGEAAHGNQVSGNYVGTDAAGTSPLGNGYFGIELYAGAHGNTIGGSSDQELNIVADSGMSGIVVSHAGADGNTIQNNRVGTDAAGVLDLGNTQHGVYILAGAQDNTFGPDNVVAFSGEDGFHLSGGDTFGNTITQNSVFANTGAGIHLLGGANHGMLPPTISTTEQGSVIISGTACAGCTVELFQNQENDGEGKIYLGTTAADGSGSFSLTLSSLQYPYLTATATRPADGTSSFSSAFTATYLGDRYLYLPLTMR